MAKNTQQRLDDHAALLEEVELECRMSGWLPVQYNFEKLGWTIFKEGTEISWLYELDANLEPFGMAVVPLLRERGHSPMGYRLARIVYEDIGTGETGPRLVSYLESPEHVEGVHWT